MTTGQSANKLLYSLIDTGHPLPPRPPPTHHNGRQFGMWLQGEIAQDDTFVKSLSNYGQEINGAIWNLNNVPSPDGLSLLGLT